MVWLARPESRVHTRSWGRVKLPLTSRTELGRVSLRVGRVLPRGVSLEGRAVVRTGRDGFQAVNSISANNTNSSLPSLPWARPGLSPISDLQKHHSPPFMLFYFYFGQGPFADPQTLNQGKRRWAVRRRVSASTVCTRPRRAGKASPWGMSEPRGQAPTSVRAAKLGSHRPGFGWLLLSTSACSEVGRDTQDGGRSESRRPVRPRSSLTRSQPCSPSPDYIPFPFGLVITESVLTGGVCSCEAPKHSR